MLQPTENISRDEGREIVTELFTLYMKHIAKLCADYGIEPETFRATMNKAFEEI